MTKDEEKQISRMLEEGKSYAEIAAQLGNQYVWNDIQAYANENQILSWQGAKRAITLRLNRFSTATQQAERESLGTEIDQFVSYLYDCARKVQDKIESARKVLG